VLGVEQIVRGYSLIDSETASHEVAAARRGLRKEAGIRRSICHALSREWSATRVGLERAVAVEALLTCSHGGFIGLPPRHHIVNNSARRFPPRPALALHHFFVSADTQNGRHSGLIIRHDPPKS